MRFLGGSSFLLDFFVVFFREGRTPGGAVIFLMLLPFTPLGVLDRETDCGVGKRSSSSRKTPMSGQPWTAVGGCSEGLFVGSALAGVLLPGGFIVLLVGRANAHGRFPFHLSLTPFPQKSNPGGV
jgi:hypothetical protein